MDIEVRKQGIYRYYQIEDLFLPSVTSLLGLLPKPGIIYWAVMNTIKFLSKQKTVTKKISSQAFVFHKQLLSKLADEGTLYHDMIEEYLRSGKEEDHNAITRFKEFEKESGLVVDKMEHVVWSNTEGYKTAGTADLIGKCSEIPIGIDIKTSKEIRLSHKIQSCIYVDMYCEQNGLDRSEFKSGVLLIPRDRKTVWKFHINTEEEEAKYRKIFAYLSKLFHTLVELEEISLT